MLLKLQAHINERFLGRFGSRSLERKASETIRILDTYGSLLLLVKSKEEVRGIGFQINP